MTVKIDNVQEENSEIIILENIGPGFLFEPPLCLEQKVGV